METTLEPPKTHPATSMMPGEVPRDPNKAFKLVEGLLFDQVHKFHQRYGGDRSELEGQAGLAFVKGHAEFITGKTNGGQDITDPYATSIRRWIWFSMFDAMRIRIPKNDATEAIGERDFQAPVADKWDINEWGFGTDAEFVVKLMIDPPRSVALPAERKGGTPRNLRSTVREWLVDRGWHPDRIGAAFNEIKEALK